MTISDDPATDAARPERADLALTGHAGELYAARWSGADPSYVVVLAHGYGEHVGRYEWVAERLVADGAAVYGLDHLGHGRSEGERVSISDFEDVVADLDLLVERTREEHAGLPLVLLGHSMGGMIAARYTQLHADVLTCTLLSGPVLGSWPDVTDLLALAEIPPTPIDPSTLSRDPAVGRDYEADELVWHGDFRRETLEAIREELATIAAGGTLAVPTLWLHGGDDRLVPIGHTREGWAVIRGEEAAERSYPGARHEILNETNRSEVMVDVLAFVHRHLAD